MDCFLIIKTVTPWLGTVPVYIVCLWYWAILRSLGTRIIFRTTHHPLQRIGPQCVPCVLGCSTTACLWPCGCCRHSPAHSLDPFHRAMESCTILPLSIGSIHETRRTGDTMLDSACLVSRPCPIIIPAIRPWPDASPASLVLVLHTCKIFVR